MTDAIDRPPGGRTSIEPAHEHGAPIQLQRLFELAVQQGPQGVDALERLVALQAQVEARQAQRDFSASMADFKAECPPIPRRTENNQFTVTTAGGVKAPRMYASLEDIEATVREPLGRNRLSYRWGDVKIDGGKITMACIVFHAGGHSETSSVPMPVDSKAGCSEQQKHGTAMEYARRYSLINALGLTSCDDDADGNEDVARITPEQVLVMESLIDKRPAGSRARLLAWTKEQWGAATLEEIPASRFEWLKADLEAKIARQK